MLPTGGDHSSRARKTDPLPGQCFALDMAADRRFGPGVLCARRAAHAPLSRYAGKPACQLEEWLDLSSAGGDGGLRRLRERALVALPAVPPSTGDEIARTRALPALRDEAARLLVLRPPGFVHRDGGARADARDLHDPLFIFRAVPVDLVRVVHDHAAGRHGGGRLGVELRAGADPP